MFASSYLSFLQRVANFDQVVDKFSKIFRNVAEFFKIVPKMLPMLPRFSEKSVHYVSTFKLTSSQASASSAVLREKNDSAFYIRLYWSAAAHALSFAAHQNP